MHLALTDSRMPSDAMEGKPLQYDGLTPRGVLVVGMAIATMALLLVSLARLGSLSIIQLKAERFAAQAYICRAD